MFKRDIDKIYEKLLIKYDNYINELDKKNFRKCTCCKQCAHCCHQLIIITDFEKEILKYTISSMIKKDQKKLYQIVKKQCEILNQNNLNKETIIPSLSFEEQQIVQQKFFDLNLICPFLKNNSCSIYNRRQIACLTYRNYGDSSECEKTINVSNAYTFNNVEIEMRKELLQNTGVFPDGFNILQFAILEILETENLI